MAKKENFVAAVTSLLQARQTRPDLGINASLRGYRPFPANNPWNQAIDREPVDPTSAALLAHIGAGKGLHADFGTVWDGAPNGIPYIVVGAGTPRVAVTFDYARESDPGPYPVPPIAPIEGRLGKDGDHHLIVLDRDSQRLYELYAVQRGRGGYHAGSGAIFDLRTNALRPAGWTSADAAGLPIFPGLVRYDEVVEGRAVRHALRFTVRQTRRAYVPPARHFASHRTEWFLPPLGMRVRLKAAFDTSGFPPPVQVILQALKTYGMILADNGSDFYLSGAPNSRWNDRDLATLSRVKGSDLEVVLMRNVVNI